MKLTAEQIRSFANTGYILMSNLLDSNVIDQAVEHCWSRFPAHFDRNDPKSWHGEVTDCCFTLDIKGRAGLVKFQHGFKEQVDVETLLSTDKVQNIARQLIAEGVVLDKPIVRGLYSVLPIPKYVSFPHRGHNEVHPFQIGAIGYLNDVKVGCGAFSVWPGSHKLLYQAFDSKLDFVANSKYHALESFLNKFDPVQIPGKKGDVILFHHRLFHAPSNNNGCNIRFAYLCDFRTKNYKALCDQKPGELWEDWPNIRSYLDPNESKTEVSHGLNNSLWRKLWINAPKLRGIIYNRLMNQAAKDRAKMSRDARSRQSIHKPNQKN